MAWLTGYGKRKQVNLTGQSGAGTNYQVVLSIGEDSGGDFSVPSSLSFPHDLRFADDDQTTQLDYWIEDLTVDPVTAWVEVADDLGSNLSIYCYYSKSGDTTTSDGDNTFLFFDDFEDGVVDTIKWNTAVATFNSITESGGYLICEASADGQYLNSKYTSMNDNFAILAKGKMSNGWLALFPHSPATGDPWDFGETILGAADKTNSWIRIERGNNTRATAAQSWSADTDYIMKYYKIGTALDLYIYDAAGVLIKSLSTTVITAPSGRTFSIRSSGATTQSFDYIAIKKYISVPPEPAFASAGDEEAPQIFEYGSATLSGVGSLASAGKRIRSVKGTLSGSGSIAASAHRIFAGKAGLTGTGSVEVNARRIFAGKVGLTGAGTLAGLSYRIRSGLATISGNGLLAAIGTVIEGGGVKYGSATLLGAGVISAKGRAIYIAKASISGSGNVVGVGRRILHSTGTLSGTGGLDVAGRRVFAGKGGFTGLGTLSAIGTIVGEWAPYPHLSGRGGGIAEWSKGGKG